MLFWSEKLYDGKQYDLLKYLNITNSTVFNFFTFLPIGDMMVDRFEKAKQKKNKIKKKPVVLAGNHLGHRLRLIENT